MSSKMNRSLIGSGLALLCLLASACDSAKPAPKPALAPASLQAHSAEFERGVVKVTDGVYVAIGYGIANSIMLEGDDGLVIVDTLESLEAAQEVAAEFRKISDKPVKAIIYTHSHPDHIGGAVAFVPSGTAVPVYAQETVASNMDKTASELQPIITPRSLRMYGSRLPPDERINIGIGGALALHDDANVDTLRPTRIFSEQLDDTVAGIHFQLVHAPGETTDQLYVWLPELRVLLCGDNFYKAFPNLYTIRGTSYRDPLLWVQSLDRMRALNAEFLVPSHTRPLSGAANVSTTLTDYRDAISYTYDQTIRLINQGLEPEQIAARIRLPAPLAASPYLQEFYGKTSWSAKSIFNGALGWYSGNPDDLQPLEPLAEAQRMVELAGGVSALDDKLEAAAQKQDWQWALQLSGFALRVNAGDQRARSVRIEALKALGAAEANAPARDWYFTAARELAGEFELPKRSVKPSPAMLAQMPLSTFFRGMAVNLRAEDALDLETRVGFSFSDSGERYTYIVRRGASELVAGVANDVDLSVQLPTQAFKEMLAGVRNPALTMATDIDMLKGSKLDFARFMKRFQPD